MNELAELRAKRDRATNPIQRQMLDIKIARLKSRRSGKPVKVDKRNTETLFRNAKGEWRKRVAGSRKSVKAKAPKGKYRDKSGRWRDARNSHRLTEAPIQFRPLKIGRQKTLKHDERAKETLVEHFEEQTPDSWGLQDLVPVLPRRASNPYAPPVVGWRTRFDLRNNSVEPLCVFSDLARALRQARKDDVVAKAFMGRRSMLRVLFRRPDGTEEWMTMGLALKWGNLLYQASNLADEKDLEYTIYDGDDPDAKKSHTILIARFSIE